MLTAVRKFTLTCGLCYVVGFSPFVSAHAAEGEQQPAKKPAPAKPAAAKPKGEVVPPSIADFEKIYDEALEIAGEIGKLEGEFRKAKEADRPAIVQKYQGLAAAINERAALLVDLQPEIEKLYLKDPKANKKAEQFLAERIGRSIEGDDYEEAVRLGQLLVKGGFENPAIHQAIGAAAFNMEDLDLAESELKQAKELKALEEDGKVTLALLPEFREEWAKEQDIRAAEAKADDLPRVKLATSKGDITIELFENQAPNSVANFINLVEKKFYDGLPFHRVLPGFMAQGGDPEGNGTGGPGYHIACECYRDDYRKHFRGTLSMAHAGKDTGGSQFFLTFRPTGHLDGKHTAFGRVIQGMEVLKDLQRVNPQFPGGPKPDVIETATVLRKRDHKYVPKKVADEGAAEKPE